MTDEELAAWALSHGWTTERVSMYDEEGVEGWGWNPPAGVNGDFSPWAIGPWDESPAMNHDVRVAIIAHRGETAEEQAR